MDKSLNMARTRYKKYFDKSLRSIPTFKKGGYVYVDLPRRIKENKEIDDERKSK